MKITIKIAERKKDYVTFYLYIDDSQTCMTLSHDSFAGLCSLLSRGQVGLPSDKVEVEGFLLEL